MLTELLKRISEMKKRGYASKDEKAKLATDIATLKSEDQEAIADSAEDVAELPETDPNAGDEDVEDAEIQKGLKSLLTRAVGEIKDEVKTYIQEFKNEMSTKSGVYNADVQAKRKENSTNLRTLAKALLAGDLAKVKEMTTDATGTPFAGYTIDSELDAEIRHLITEYGAARREMFALPLTKGSYRANDLVTDVSVFWVDEGVAIPSTEVVLGQEELTLKKLAAIVTLTNELLEDSEIDFIDFLARRIAEKLAQAEDLAFFTGNGTSPFGGFTGVLNASDVPEVIMTGTSFADIDADDLLDLVDKVPTAALANGKFFLHRTIMSYIRKLREYPDGEDGKGAYIYQAPSQSGPATIWGYPVVLVEAFPTKTQSAADKSFVLFGDLRTACIFGYKGAIKVARSNSAVVRNVAGNADINSFTTDREAIRWTERVGYIRILPQAIARLTTGGTSA